MAKNERKTRTKRAIFVVIALLLVMKERQELKERFLLL